MAKKPIKKKSDGTEKANKYLQQSIDNLTDKIISQIQDDNRGVWSPSVLQTFKSTLNPVTKTVYSPLNTMLLNKFIDDNQCQSLMFITKAEAMKRFGAESLEGSKNAWALQSFKSSFCKYELNGDGKYKLDGKGQKIVQKDDQGKPITGHYYGRKFSAPLVNVSMINSPDVPEHWKKPTPTRQCDSEFLRKLIDFVSEEVAPCPVRRSPVNTHSYCNEKEIVLAPVGEYRSTLVELSSLLHEVGHITGFYDLKTGALIPEENRRENLRNYSLDDQARATEELTTQIALQGLISGLNIEDIDQAAYQAAMDNHDIYNSGWGSALLATKDGRDQLRQGLETAITEGNKVFVAIVDRIALKMKEQPELLAEVEQQLGSNNIISMKVGAAKQQEEKLKEKQNNKRGIKHGV